MSSQGWINIVSFVWSVIHDPIFFGIYWLLTNKFHIIRTRMTTDQRIKRIERVLIGHLRLHAHKRDLARMIKEHGVSNIPTKEANAT